MRWKATVSNSKMCGYCGEHERVGDHIMLPCMTCFKTGATLRNYSPSANPVFKIPPKQKE